MVAHKIPSRLLQGKTPEELSHRTGGVGVLWVKGPHGRGSLGGRVPSIALDAPGSRDRCAVHSCVIGARALQREQRVLVHEGGGHCRDTQHLSAVNGCMTKEQ